MKKLLLTLCLVSGVAFGADASDKEESIKTMQDLEKSLAFIQKGFLYNSDTMVKKGVKDFKSLLRHSDAFVVDLDEKDSTGDFRPRSYASVEVRAIDKLADGIEENFKTGTKEKSVEFYNQAVNRCFTCHRIIRKW